jgi:hypothetical protein
LGPLGTEAVNRPVVPVPGDYDEGEIGGMMVGRGNPSTRRKPDPVPLCPPKTRTCCPEANAGRRGWKSDKTRLTYGTVLVRVKVKIVP